MRWIVPVAMAVLLTACGEPAVDRAELTVPDPDTSQLEASLAEWLLGVRDDVRAGVADPHSSREDLASRFGDYGQVLHAFDLRQAAIEAYAQAARLDPDDFRWRYLSARVKEFAGDLQAAERDLMAALRIDPNNAHAWVRLGDVQRGRGDADAAIDSYLRANDLQTTAAAHFGLGQAYLAREEFEQTTASFERALELQPAATAVYIPLAQALRSLGLERQAEEALARRGRQGVVLDDPTEDALDDVRILGAYQALLSMAVAPELNADDLMMFAIRQLGDVKGSDEALTRDLSALERQDVAETRRQRARLHYALGGLRVYQERDESAAQNFERALELAPGTLEAEVKLGNLLARRGAFEEAVERYDRVLVAEPDNAEALVKRGTALLNLRQPQRAARDLRRALEVDPSDALARVRLAEALEVAGELNAAEQRLRSALESPDLDARGRALVLRGLGDFLVRRQRLDGAVQALRRALDEDRTLVSAQLRLADVLAALGRHDEALGEYAEVIAAQPSNVVAHRHRAAALLLSEEPREAIEALEIALALNSDNRAIQHQLARLLAVGAEPRDPQRALELVTAVHEQDPTAASAVTLSMALAAASRFEEAIQVEAGLPPTLHQRQRLAAYRQGRAYETDDPGELVVMPR